MVAMAGHGFWMERIARFQKDLHHVCYLRGDKLSGMLSGFCEGFSALCIFLGRPGVQQPLKAK